MSILLFDQTFRFVDVIDILIVAIAVYYLLLWLQGTRAVQLIRGFVILLIIYLAGKLLGLHTINWLFDKFTTIILVLLIIVFQPELRRALERIGRGRLLAKMGLLPEAPGGWFVKHLIKAVGSLAEQKIGALIVLERNTGLSEYLESGIKLDAIISVELLVSIFSQKSPLHDGAVVIQSDRIVSAGCLLPLSETKLIDTRLGTRHRAAIGISEQTDAFVIVVSERVGRISIAENGYLTRGISREMLEERLFSLYRMSKKEEDKK